jgi:hypothetical protein
MTTASTVDLDDFISGLDVALEALELKIGKWTGDEKEGVARAIALIKAERANLVLGRRGQLSLAISRGEAELAYAIGYSDGLKERCSKSEIEERVNAALDSLQRLKTDVYNQTCEGSNEIE